MMFSMSAPFLKSLGFGDLIRGAVGTAGLLASMTGSLAAGPVIARWGLRRAMLPIAAVQSLAILLYVALAVARPGAAVVSAVVVVEQLAAAVGDLAARGVPDAALLRRAQGGPLRHRLGAHERGVDRRRRVERLPRLAPRLPDLLRPGLRRLAPGRGPHAPRPEGVSSAAQEDAMALIDHLTLNVSDYARSKAFYEKALAPLGVTPVMEYGQACRLRSRPEAGLLDRQGPDHLPEARAPRAPSRPSHVAFSARSRGRGGRLPRRRPRRRRHRLRRARPPAAVPPRLLRRLRPRPRRPQHRGRVPRPGVGRSRWGTPRGSPIPDQIPKGMVSSSAARARLLAEHAHLEAELLRERDHLARRRRRRRPRRGSTGSAPSACRARCPCRRP